MKDETSSVKSAQRTLEILETVARSRDGINFVDLAASLPYPKSSLHGLLQTIVAMRWLDVRSGAPHVLDRREALGGRAVLPAEPRTGRPCPAIPAARRTSSSGRPCSWGSSMISTWSTSTRSRGNQPLRLISNIGSRLPAYVTGIGKAFLAGLPRAGARGPLRGRRVARLHGSHASPPATPSSTLLK